MEGLRVVAAVTFIVMMMTMSVAQASIAVDCTTVTSLISACSSFVTYGAPDPFPGSPCCQAMASLNNLSDTVENRQSVCRCIMGLITSYNPNATAIATLPGFCGVSLGFTIDPNTDCN
ncbi:putative non-specific lipid-transfer protein 14 [Heracleum sosnowskyi]|uniref:Non-specific lipid-transfer protein n=1 Tax=Heracleum sosnowskyi TaxID=360622 RepID=A0AAD8J7Z3_9APIA|nr:putative non-specific lipid-transfer protein 14 [Heracleum sosnowskyi]